MTKLIKKFTALAQEDVRKIITDLVEWAEKNPNGVLLFESPIINMIFYKMTYQNVNGYKSNSNVLVVENIMIEWENIGGRKAILKRILEKESGQNIYIQPISWENAEIWCQL